MKEEGILNYVPNNFGQYRHLKHPELLGAAGGTVKPFRSKKKRLKLKQMNKYGPLYFRGSAILNYLIRFLKSFRRWKSCGPKRNTTNWRKVSKPKHHNK